MQQIAKFKAYTGREFNDADACLDYEARCEKADAVIARLEPKPKALGCDFENGAGFIQHDPKVFAGVRADLLGLAMKESDHKWLKQSIDDPAIYSSWAGRIIGECCNEQLQSAWYRISCTDDLFREWGQPYFARHQDEGKHICLNAS